jgi:hypothetical protein
VVFGTWFFADGFLVPVKELGFWTNPGHWVRVLDATGSYMYIASKPYLIKEPPEHVHQIPPFQNKHMLKDLIQFAKFRYGRGVIVPIG